MPTFTQDLQPIRVLQNDSRWSERGNVFFTLFGAVAVVGVLGAGIMSTMRGPLSTMVEVNRREQAKADMRVSANLILNVSDDESCEGASNGDSYKEGPAPTGSGPTGGGEIPGSVAAVKTDPWGTAYGYCAWNNGPGVVPADTDSCGTVLAGGTGTTSLAIALISAGPDRQFDTTCADSPAYLSDISGADDDIVIPLTYNEAVAGTGGLWEIADADTAEIDRDLNVTSTNDSTFAGGLDVAGNVDLRVGAASLFLPDETVLTVCSPANDGLLRLNKSGANYTVEVCQNPNFVSAGSLWTATGSDIYYTTGNVGIGLNNPNDALDVVGTAQITGATVLGSTLGVGGLATLDSLTVTNASNLSGTLTVTGTSALNNDTVIQGSTADNSAAALDVQDSGGNSLLFVRNDGNVGVGVNTPNDSLDVSGAADVTEGLKIDGNWAVYANSVSMAGSLLLGDAGNISTTGTNNTLVGEGTANSISSGSNNTILGAGSAATLTTGDSNIIIGQGIDVSGAAASNELNIGGAITGNLSTNDITLANDLDVTGAATATSLTLDGAGTALSVTNNADIDGVLEADDYTYQGTSFIPAACDSDEKLDFESGAWTCESYDDVVGGGDGVGADGLTDVLGNSGDGGNQAISNVSTLAVGSGTLTGGLTVDVTGNVGATQYCDADGTNCYATAQMHQDIGEVLGVGNNAGGAIDLLNLRGIALGSATLSNSTNLDLILDVTGDVGAVEYCDAAGANCFDAASVAGLVSGAVTEIDDLSDATTDYATDFNMFMGDNAGASIATGGQYNIAIGQNAADATTTGDNNIAIGYDALTANTDTSDMIAIGANALDAYSAAASGGGDRMLAIGSDALGTATDGRRSIAIGESALAFWDGTPGGSDNTAVGAAAFNHLLTGATNTALGSSAGSQVTGGGANLFLGYSTGAGVSFGQTGVNHNIFLGVRSGSGLETGASRNIAIGYQTGSTSAGNGIGAGTDNILIGYEADVSANDASNELNIGGAIFGNLSTNRIGIGVADSTAIDTDAVLELDGTNVGFLPPRNTDPSSTIGATTAGMIAYNSTSNELELYDGTAWVSFSGSGGGDNLGDHTATQTLNIGTNNINGDTDTTEGVTIDTAGRVTITSLSGTPNDILSLINPSTADGSGNVLRFRSSSVPLAEIQSVVDGAATDGDLIFQVRGSNTLAEAMRITSTGAVGIGTAGAPDANAALEVTGTNLGFLPPRNANPGSNITGTAGLIAYDSTDDELQFFDGTTWIALSDGTIPDDSLDWDKFTDTMTLDATTTIDMDTNTADLNFDSDTFVIDSANNRVGIGTATPAEALDIAGNASIRRGDTYGVTHAGSYFEVAGLNSSNQVVLGPLASNTNARVKVSNAVGVQLQANADNITFENLALNGEAARFTSTGVLAIGTTTPDANALLDLTSSTLGFLPPRNANPGSNITGTAGLIAYDSTDNELQFYDGSAWVSLSSGVPVVALNDLTDVLNDSTTDFDGDTTDDDDNLFIGHLASSLTGTGSPGARNISVGVTAGTSMTGGDDNTLMGYQAGAALTTGSTNVAIGALTLDSLTSGSRNTAIGYSAMGSTGSFNTAVGAYSLQSSGSASSGNTAVGDNSLSNNSTGGDNVAIGKVALRNNTTGDRNVAIGAEAAGTFSFTGDINDNTLIGYKAGQNLDDGADNNILLGFQAGDLISSGASNIIIGYDVDPSGATVSNELNIGGVLFGDLSTNRIGIGVTNATAIDTNAALEVTGTNLGFLPPRNTDPGSNITGTAGLIAYDSTDNELQFYDGSAWVTVSTGVPVTELNDLSDATTDYTIGFNMFMGDGAGANNPTGAQFNIAIGQNAFDSASKTNAADSNTAIGYNTLTANTDGASNVAIGNGSLDANTEGNDNVGIGPGTLGSNSTGIANIALGRNTLLSNTSGSNNVGIGFQSLRRNTTGQFNIAIGRDALFENTTSTSNIGIGYQAMINNDTGSLNTVIGTEAAGNSSLANGTYTGHTLIGYQAGYNLNAGTTNNLLVGLRAGDLITTGSDNIIIGNDVDPSGATVSNEMNIGGVLFGDLTTNRIGIGVTDATAIDTNAALEVTGTNLGFLPPRNTDPGSNITGTAGLIAYDSTDDELQFYDGSAWVAVSSGVPAVALNDLTDVLNDSTTDFDGQTDDDDDNLFIGHLATSLTGSGDPGARNTSIGVTAGDALTEGDDNTLMGYNAGTALTTGEANTAIGRGALQNTTTTNYNTAIGFGAMQLSSGASANVAIGWNALRRPTGTENVAIGFNVMDNNGSGSYNTSIGSNALRRNTEGDNNTVFGFEALGNSAATSGQMDNNTAFGARAGHNIGGGGSGAGGDNNLLIGYQAGDLITTGDNNIIIGYDVDPSGATVSNELNIGGVLFSDLSTNRIGIGVTDATAIDTNAALEVTGTNLGFLPPRNTDPGSNITGTAGLIAYDSTDNELQFYDGSAWVAVSSGVPAVALNDLTDVLNDFTTDFDGGADDDDDNLFIGHLAPTLTGAGSPGARNTVVGVTTGDALTEGDGNTLMGYDAATSLTTGASNVIFGQYSGSSITTGSNNTAIGNSAMQYAGTSATFNVAIGTQAGRYLESDRNVAIGYESGNNIETGRFNTFVGTLAGSTGSFGQTGIDSNVGLGNGALRYIRTDADNNTAVGVNTGNSVQGGSNNILLGQNADVSGVGVSNEMNIGDVIFGALDTNQIGIGVSDATAIDANAALEVTGTNLGFLPPRNTDPGSNITGTAGLIAYDSTDNQLQFYNGSAWVAVSSGTPTIALNDITDVLNDPTTDFDGQTDDDDDNLFIGHLAPTLTGDSNPGARNTSIGVTAGDALTEGDGNTLMGYNAGTALTTGESNTAIGTGALDKETTGGSNTAVGHNALGNLSGDGDLNTAIGSGAFQHWGSGDSNTIFGATAGTNATSGSNNVFMGSGAGATSPYGPSGIENNVFIGSNAGLNILTGASNNIALGHQAGNASGASNGFGSGSNNIMIGYEAGTSADNVSNELNIGGAIFGDLSTNRIGIGVTDATAIDTNAALEVTGTNLGFLPPRNTDPGSNITGTAGLIAYDSTDNELQFYDGSAWVSAAGSVTEINDLSDAFHDTTTDFDGDTVDNDDNLAIGHEFTTLDATNPGARNIAIGATALDALITADDNIAIGYDAATNLTSGSNNVGIGSGALSTTGNGIRNVAVGYNAMRDNTSGNFAVAIGYGALASATLGSNTSVGFRSMDTTSTGLYNAGLGYDILRNNTTGNANTIMGHEAAGNSSVTDGDMDNNSIFGYRAGYNLTGGASGAGANNNLLLGFQAGDIITLGDDNIVIGYDVDPSSATASNELNIGGALFGDLSTNRIGIGVTDATAIDTNAALEVTGTNLGFLPPRNADPGSNITGTAGLIAYDSTDNELQFYDGSAWVAVANSASSVTEINDLTDAITDYTTNNNVFLGQSVGNTTTVGQNNLGIGQNALNSLSATCSDTFPSECDFNIAVGIQAGEDITTGRGNNLFGYAAGTNITSGSSNTLLGHRAGEGITTSNDIVAIGFDALSGITTGGLNVGIGYRVGRFNDAGSKNIFIGHNTAEFTESSNNTAIGASSLRFFNNTTGQNTAIGASALVGVNGVSNGTSNTALGTSAGTAVTTGSNNTLMGHQVGLALTEGADNTLLGYQAGDVITTGDNNIIIGYDVDPSGATVSNELNIGGAIFGNLSTNQIGIGVSDATAIDANAALEVTGTNLGFLPPRNADPGSNITGTAGLIAYDSTDDELQFYDGSAWVALSSGTPTIALNDLTDVLNDSTTDFDGDTTDDDDNLFIGHLATSLTGSGNPGARNTSIGVTAGDALTEGDHNTLMGYNAGTALTTGESNTAIGNAALQNITTTNYNTAIGSGAMQLASGASANVAIGWLALRRPTGTQNVAIGYNVMDNNGSGSYNTSIGSNALRRNTEGDNNTVFGFEALGNSAATSGQMDNNTAFGARAGHNIGGGGSGAGGDNNLLIGYQAGDLITTGDNNIIIGYDVDPSGATVSNELNIGGVLFGDLSTNRLGIGVADATAINANAALEVTGTNLGFLPPRNADPGSNITGTAGLIAYDSTDNELQFFDGTSWVSAGGSVSAINDLTDAATDYTTDFNLFIGDNAGANVSASAQYNVAIGQDTMSASTFFSGADNSTAIGYAALSGGSALVAGQNTAIGAFALTNNGFGENNTGVGSEALTANTSGASNVAVGARSLMNATAGSNNVAVGGFAAGNESVTDGSMSNNSLFGYRAGYNLTGGAGADNNLLLGYQAGDAITSGASNIIIGYDIDPSSASASNELNLGGVVFGNLSTSQIGIGVTDATAIDANAALEVTGTNLGFLPPRNTDPTSNITGTAGLIAYDSTDNELQYYNGSAWVSLGGGAIDDLSDVTTDYATDFNMFMGDGAGANNPAGAQYNIAIGQNAFDSASKTNAADSNTAIGYNTLTANTIGARNVAIGNASLGANTEGNNNVGVGPSTLGSNTTGDANIALGRNTLFDNTTGANNLGLGFQALRRNTTGQYNIAIGRDALYENTTSSSNVGIGFNAMVNNDAGALNTVIGTQAAGNPALANGAYTGNTLIGYQTGYNMEAGANYNILIGRSSGSTITTGDNNIMIGDDAEPSGATVSNEINIGGTIFGDTSTTSVGIGALPGAGYELDVVGDLNYSGTLTNVSDRRTKTDITPLNTQEMLEKLAQIDTYSYRKIKDVDGKTEYGVIAQELEELFPDLVNTQEDEMGTKSVNYIGLIAPMIEATKELATKNDTLKNDVEDLKQQVALLNAAVSQDAGKKASMTPMMIMLLMMLGGMGAMLFFNIRYLRNRT